jgi:hypothetical protein
MKRWLPIPPDLELLNERIRHLGERIESDRSAIEQLLAPFRPAGLWVTSEAGRWRYHSRRRELRDAS